MTLDFQSAAKSRHDEGGGGKAVTDVAFVKPGAAQGGGDAGHCGAVGVAVEVPDDVEDVAEVDDVGGGLGRIRPVVRVPAVGGVAEGAQALHVPAAPAAVVEERAAGGEQAAFQRGLHRAGKVRAVERGAVAGDGGVHPRDSERGLRLASRLWRGAKVDFPFEFPGVLAKGLRRFSPRRPPRYAQKSRPQENSAHRLRPHRHRAGVRI